MDTNAASDLLGRLLDEVEGASPSAAPTTDASETATPAASAPPVAGLSSLLGGLAADPAILTSVLPSLLSVFGNGPGKGPSEATDAVPPPRPLPPDRHTALLCAVKPYLGERRQATADTVLKLCRIWDALNRAGLSPAVLGNLLGGMNSGAPASGSTAPTALAKGEVE